MSDGTSLLFAELHRVAAAVAGGELSSRARMEGLDGDSQSVAADINRMLDAVSAPLNTATEALHALGQGRIPGFVVDDYRGDFNRVKRDTNLCVAMMLGVLHEIDELVACANSGKLAARGNDWDFEGCWKDLLSRLNELVDAFIEPFHVSARYVETISQGVIPERIAKPYPGDLNRIRRNLNTLIATLKGLLADVNQLCAAAMDGRLDQRADPDRYGNEFRRIVAGINGSLDAVVEPLRLGAGALNRVAQGDLTVRLEGAFPGEFARLQRDINSMAERLRQGMEKISETSQELAATAEELAEISAALKQNAEQTMARAAMASRTSQEVAASVRALSAADGEAASAIEAIADHVGRVAREAVSADTDAQRAFRAVSQLTDAGSSIAAVVKLMSGVAGETNALSAAAQGQAETAVGASRGFEVVADEVKRLANQIDGAAESLGDKLGELRKALAAETGEGGGGAARIGREASRGVESISQVAWQTKLLSLNAAIEGARAVHSADQFMVVAREIGRLAGEAGKAASDVASRLDVVGASSREGAATIEAIATTIAGLRQSAELIAGEAQQRVAAAQRTGQLAGAATETAGQIVEHATAVAEAASSTSETVRQTDEEARRLAETAVRLREIVSGFQT